MKNKDINTIETKKERHKKQWNVVRSRYIPAIWPFISYFSWDASEMIKGVRFEYYSVWRNGNVQAIWSEDCSSKLRKELLDIVIKHKKNLKTLREKGIPAGEKLIRFCELFVKEIKDKKVKDYLEFFREFNKLYHKIMKTNMMLWVFSNVPLEKKINKLLKDYNDDEKKEILSIMSITKEDSYSKIEEKKFEDLVEIARKKGISDEAVKKKIKEFSDEYFWFPYEYIGPEIWDEDNVTKKVKEALNENVEKEEEVDIEKLQKECIKKYKLNNEVIELFKILQTLLLMQDDRKMHNSHICYYVNTVVMEQFSKLLNIDFELVRYMDDNLLEEFIQERNNKKLKEKLKKRSVFVVQTTNKKGINVFYEGEKGKELLKREGINLEVDKQTNIIKGQSANSGKVIGRARVLKTSSNVKDFKKGDIIITGMTTPDFVPLIKKCSAIITDEGGITCHAAIVSRELKKPCIIGTKIATQVLKDGDLVEVDADNGVVKIIKKSE